MEKKELEESVEAWVGSAAFDILQVAKAQGLKASELLDKIASEIEEIQKVCE